LAATLYATLPVYAVPLFVRIVDALETTTTFKSRKVELRNQGYGAEVSDPLYVLDGRGAGYVPFYASYAADVAAGRRPH
jgi:fatty-acyl-CoA synthase